MIFYIILIVLLGLDQITKALIHSKFLEGDTFPIIRDFFHLTYVQNIISISAVILMIIYAKKDSNKLPKIENYAWLFIISGAFGNILDRILRGFVIDMIDFRGIWGYIFNLADVYINIGVILMIINSIIEERAKKRGGNTK